ncbi:phosphoribosyltransferase [Limisphaera sp. 4302-co]|uniref:phosphoribosyltransferase n=1 Tax=Limisphaera sp. 4302-co TaxID=3400417 RepID=UPI003C22643C
MRFASRTEAGQLLAEHLIRAGVTADLVVGLPRGGVVVAAPVAQELDAPLTAWAVRKIGHPLNPEFAVGALAEPDVLWLDERWVRNDPEVHRALRRIVAEEQARMQALARFLHPQGLPPVRHRRIILVDDGLATGATAHAAVLALRKHDADTVHVAAPVASPEAVERLRQAADGVHVLRADPDFTAVGHYYASFEPPDEEELLQLLRPSDES